MAEEAIFNKDEGLQKLFFGGLPRETTEETFKQHVEEFGEITDLVIIKDNSGVSKGFGFVSYATGEAADACLDKYKNKAHIDGKEVEVKRAVPREMANNLEEKEKTTRVFIGGLSKVTTEESIRTFFTTTYPECVLENIELIMTKIEDTAPGDQPVHRGFGFLTFDDIHFVDKICIVKYHEIDGKKTEVKWASAKGNNTARGGRGGFGGGRGRGRGGYNQGGYGGQQYGGYGPPHGGYGPPQGGYGGYGPPPGQYGGGYGPPPYGGPPGGGYGGYQGGYQGGYNQGYHDGGSSGNGRGNGRGRYKPY